MTVVAKELTASREDIDGVMRATLDYAEGWYQGDAERHARAYHPECLKQRYEIEEDSGVTHLDVITPRYMVDRILAGNTTVVDCEVEVTIDDIYEDVASVRVYSCEWVDLLHVAKARGEWKLIHVTCQRRLEGEPQTAIRTSEDADALMGIAMDYAEGWYQGDVERFGRSMHSEFLEHSFLVEEDSGVTAMYVESRQFAMDLCATGQYVVPDCPIEVMIDDIYGDVATVRVNSCRWVLFFHATRARGSWKFLHLVYHEQVTG